MAPPKKFCAVRFDRYGGIDVLYIAEVPLPEPVGGQALIKVKAAGINPGESAIRQGAFARQWPATFPTGQGSDFAGVVGRVGEGVGTFSAGDEVIGFTDKRASQAEYVLAETGHLVRRPPNVPWEQAGALFVAGTTAYAAVKAVGLKSGDTLVVSAAAGGVGSVVVQLARNIGARVIGLASEANHPWLISKGVIPLVYGDGMETRIRQASGGRTDAFIDCFGHGYVELALNLGIAPSRIDTIIDFAAGAKYDIRTAGNHQGAKAEVLAELAGLIAAGRLEVPIAHTYPLARVRDAYRELERRHTHGKIVLVP